MDTQHKLPLSMESITKLVDVFYDRIQVHPTLGPVFNAAVHDWPEHKRLLVSFWSSVALKAQTYRGNPMREHHGKGIQFEHFDQWLELWKDTSNEILDAESAEEMQMYATRIGRSLSYGLGLSGAHGGRNLGVPVIQ